jgi:hypothetical protein
MLNKCFCITYLIYTVLAILSRVVVMVFVPIPVVFLLFGLGIVLELVVFRY